MTTLLPPDSSRPYATLLGDGGESPGAIPEQQLIDAYKTYGALLLRGYKVELNDFRGLTERLCSGSVFNESPDRKVVDAERNIQTVNGGLEAFPLHPELSRTPWKPDVCFFWCASPPSTSGETLVCDGVDIVRRMPQALRAAFENRRLLYLHAAAPDECRFWLGSPQPTDDMLRNPPRGCPYRFRRFQGKVLRVFSRPALHKPMFTNELAFGNFLLFARYLLSNRTLPVFDSGEQVSDELVAQVKAVADPITYPVQWRQGDIAILDNTRFMHGRNAIVDAEERLISTYFGYLRFAIPDPEEPAGAPWRTQSAFKPPDKGAAFTGSRQIDT